MNLTNISNTNINISSLDKTNSIVSRDKLNIAGIMSGVLLPINIDFAAKKRWI